VEQVQQKVRRVHGAKKKQAKKKSGAKKFKGVRVEKAGKKKARAGGRR
jgi:hypothetical protein